MCCVTTDVKRIVSLESNWRICVLLLSDNCSGLDNYTAGVISIRVRCSYDKRDAGELIWLYSQRSSNVPILTAERIAHSECFFQTTPRTISSIIANKQSHTAQFCILFTWSKSLSRPSSQIINSTFSAWHWVRRRRQCWYCITKLFDRPGGRHCLSRYITEQGIQIVESTFIGRHRVGRPLPLWCTRLGWWSL